MIRSSFVSGVRAPGNIVARNFLEYHSERYYEEDLGRTKVANNDLNMAPNVVIITDTNNCLPPELIQELDIRIIPLRLIIDGKEYRDQIDIHTDEFWKGFDDYEQISNAPPTPGDFLEAFKEAGRRTDSIACVLVSKALSAVYKMAVVAAEIVSSENPTLKIQVIDSKTAAGAQGFIALEAARAARAGKSLVEVVRVIQDMVGRAKWVCAVETTKYLIKSGRVPAVLAQKGMLDLKPIIAQLHGTGLVENLGMVKSKPEYFLKLMEVLGENIDINRPLHAMVHYTNNYADGQELIAMVQTKYLCEEIYLTPYSPVLSWTSGPSLAISFFS
jgi:DegV family protein with EDD domain